MTHEDIQTLIAAIPLERMDAETRRQVNAHVAACEQCREMAAFSTELEAAAKPLQSAGARDAVMGRLSAGLPRRQRVEATLAGFAWRHAAAALVAVTVGGLVAWSLVKPAQEQAANGDNASKPVVVPLDLTPAVADNETAESTEPAPVAAIEAPAEPWIPTTKEEEQTFADNMPKPTAVKSSGKARLRPDTRKYPDNDTLSLTTGTVGLHIMDSDIRVQRSVRANRATEMISVAMGGFDNSSLIDLDSGNTLETRALELRAGLRCLLHVNHADRREFYVITVTGYEPNEYVDVEWSVVAPSDAHQLAKPLVAARQPAVHPELQAPQGAPRKPVPIINAKPLETERKK